MRSSGSELGGVRPTSEADALLRLRGVFEQLPAAVAVLVGESHRFEFANSAYLELVGHREVEGRTVEEAVPEAREQGFIDLLDEVLRSGERAVGREVRAVLLHEDRFQEVFVDFTFQPFRGAEGEVEGILVHAVDVTESVQARTQLQEVLRREQEDRLRQAIDSLMDTVIIAAPVRDGDGRVADFTVTFVNAGSDEVARRQREDLVGRRFTVLWPNVGQSGLLAQYAAVVETGEPLVLEDYHYREIVGDEEVEGVFDVRATRLGDDLFLAFRDVTERVRRERALAESRARLAREHEVVAALQDALIPRDVPDVDGAEVSAAYVAASENFEVGGDWFDVFHAPGGCVALAIGDVAGKGIDAAQLMAQLRIAGRVAALSSKNPADILAAQNSLMLAAGAGPFATSVFALYDPASGVLRWASAGHLPPLLVDADGHGEYLDVEGAPPLGVSADPAYACHQALIPPGGRLVLYTDGLVERREESLADGLARLREAVPPHGTPADACSSLLDRLGVTSSRSDDVCVLVLDRSPSQ